MKTTTVHEKLGLTQREVAMLLGVGTSHYSMFESGKRSLPLHAQQRLAELLTAANKPIPKPNPSEKTAQLKQIISKHLEENSYYQALTERKIAALRRQKAKVTSLQTIGAALSTTDKGALENFAPLVAFKVKTANTSSPDRKLSELELKMELLLEERKFLELKLRELSK